MSKVLVVAEHDGTTLNASTAKSLACATQIPDAEIDIVVFADGGADIANAAAQLESVARVLLVDNAANQHALAAVIAPQLAALADGYSHLLGPSTTFGKDLMPRVAALRGVNQISDVMAVLESHKFKRPIYAGNVIVTIEAPADTIERFFRECIRPALGERVTASAMAAAYEQWCVAGGRVPVSSNMFGRLAPWRKDRIGGRIWYLDAFLSEEIASAAPALRAGQKAQNR